MKVISIIECPEIIKKILRHLGLWEKKARPPPKIFKSGRCILHLLPGDIVLEFYP
jgi:hypothetical protein